MNKHKEKQWYQENTNINEIDKKFVDNNNFIESFLLEDYNDEDIKEKFLIIFFINKENQLQHIKVLKLKKKKL